MGKTSIHVSIRCFLSVAVFLSMFALLPDKSSAENMILTPVPSKEKGFREGTENWYVGGGYFKNNTEKRLSTEDVDVKWDISHLYGILGYRFSDWTEIYSRVGIAEYDIEGVDTISGKVFFTLGTNLKWYNSRSKTFSVWSTFQANYYWPQNLPPSEPNERVELKMLNVTAAPLAADYNIPISSMPELLSIYGGVLAQYTWADGEVTNLLTSQTGEFKLRDTSHVGLFAGLRVIPLKGLNIHIEGQYMERVSYGVNLVYAFPVDY